MATATQAVYTPEDLLQIRDRPMPELVDGQLVERAPMGRRSDAVAARILCLLGAHVDAHGLGVINGSQGSYQVFPDDPKKVRIPDVSFTRRERQAEGQVEEGHGKIAPDLVVEVISPNDLAVDLCVKVRDFLDAGVRQIWVANQGTRDIVIYRSDTTAAILQGDDVLDGGDVLPGFRCTVSDLFKI